MKKFIMGLVIVGLGFLFTDSLSAAPTELTFKEVVKQDFTMVAYELSYEITKLENLSFALQHVKQTNSSQHFKHIAKNLSFISTESIQGNKPLVLSNRPRDGLQYLRS